MPILFQKEFKLTSVYSNETSVNALPFQSSTEIDQSITFSVSFSPQILLGVSTAVGFARGGVGASFDLPKLSVEISSLDHVDPYCKPLAGSEGSIDDDGHLISFGNFANITPSVELNFDVFAELELDVGATHKGLNTNLTLGHAEIELEGACLMFDNETEAYGSPDSIFADAGGDLDPQGEGESDGDGDKEGGASWSGGQIGGMWKWGLLAFVVFIGI